MLYVFCLCTSFLHILPNLNFDPKRWWNDGMDMNLGLEQVTNDIWNISQLAKMRKSP
jgi:hypothetical protein